MLQLKTTPTTICLCYCEKRRKLMRTRHPYEYRASWRRKDFQALLELLEGLAYSLRRNH
jgi:hypothetical protein